MENNQKKKNRPLDYFLIGIITLCVILVLFEIYTNVTQEIGLALLNSYGI